MRKSIETSLIRGSSGRSSVTTAPPVVRFLLIRRGVVYPQHRQVGDVFGRRPNVRTVMYQDLLLATDGSDGARRATDHALALADRLDATLHVLSVAEEGPHSSEKRDKMRSDPEGEAIDVVETVERTATAEGRRADDGSPRRATGADSRGRDGLRCRSDRRRDGRTERARPTDRRQRRRGGRRNAPVPVVTVREGRRPPPEVRPPAADDRLPADRIACGPAGRSPG